LVALNPQLLQYTINDLLRLADKAGIPLSVINKTAQESVERLAAPSRQSIWGTGVQVSNKVRRRPIILHRAVFKEAPRFATDCGPVGYGEGRCHLQGFLAILGLLGRLDELLNYNLAYGLTHTPRSIEHVPP